MWRRKSSAAWDSTAEVLALAHNSRPSRRALRNTSAGIQCLGTYGKIAVIRARPVCPNPAGAGAEAAAAAPRVELVTVEEEADGAVRDVEAVIAKAEGLTNSDEADKEDAAAVAIRQLGNGAVAGQSSSLSCGGNLSPAPLMQRRTTWARVVPDQVYG
jgi:hypothetical protein